jgi:hypothetical protein
MEPHVGRERRVEEEVGDVLEIVDHATVLEAQLSVDVSGPEAHCPS